MTAMITLPGFGGSGETHWQTLWEARDQGMLRFQPASWDHPDLDNWTMALDRAIAAVPEPPLLVAHSLGCLLVAHWAARVMKGAGQLVRGAFLVAVPDPEDPDFPTEAPTFRDVSEMPLPFPALVVASTDDPYCTLEYARRRAVSWEAGFVLAGALGHINGAKGLGDWPQGAMLLEAFRAGTTRFALEVR